MNLALVTSASKEKVVEKNHYGRPREDVANCGHGSFWRDDLWKEAEYCLFCGEHLEAGGVNTGITRTHF
jgi:hypothetical protein